MVKALFWTAWLHSLKRIISLQVHVSAWNSDVSSQGATVPTPANCQDRRLLWLPSRYLWSLCCVLGFQCLQGHELEAPHHILAQELLSQFPCVCLEASHGSLSSTASKGNPLSFLASTQAAEGLRLFYYYYYFNIAAEYLFKARVHILREKTILRPW